MGKKLVAEFVGTFVLVFFGVGFILAPLAGAVVGRAVYSVVRPREDQLVG